jgi:hypothetical protein
VIVHKVSGRNEKAQPIAMDRPGWVVVYGGKQKTASVMVTISAILPWTNTAKNGNIVTFESPQAKDTISINAIQGGLTSCLLV